MSIETLYQIDKVSSRIFFTFLGIYPLGENRDHLMMTFDDITNIRRLNARMLADEIGGQAEFGRRVSMGDAQISHLLGEKKVKNIGAIVARRIEKAFDKPVGWLDVYHPAAPNIMLEVTPEEARIIEIYRSSSTGKVLIDGAISTSFNLPAAASGGR